MPGVQTCVLDRKSTRLNSSHLVISYAVFCLKKKKHHTLAAGVLPLTQHLPVSLAHPAPSPRRTEGCGGDVCCRFRLHRPLCFFFFFNDTATTEIYTLSLHDALPI